ncbi:phage tail tape measure protein [Streptomyces erythrochromogenes]|uniref:phage tail tape measure protein n=1 Tax=Streptomyces erythrochromogenes TaxID=285574 RepID=UPI0036748959
MSSYTLSVQMRADAANLLSSIRGASGALRSLGRDVDAVHRTLGRVGTGASGLRGIAADSDSARRGLRQVGSEGDAAMRQLRRGLLGARQEAHHLRNLVVGGGIGSGLAEIAKEGNEYQRAIQKWGAVTGASGQEMVMAAAKARELGSDLTIPGTSATKAADAMLELAKAGQTATSSIANGRAAMQLAAADNLSAADAAKYLGDVMDQFGLSSNHAGRAADVLASGANAASGGLKDIYYAMSYTGPVAAQLGVSIEDTATAVAMLARSGILGSKAGTSLRGIFTNLAAPTKRMKEGLAELGIEAWDTQGNFKGLREIVEGFEKAGHRLSDKDFAAAMSKVVGKPALQGALALAHQGTEAFDQMRTAIGRTGAAGEIAESQTKGLAGAVTQLKSQWKTTGQVLYTSAAPGLEKVTRLLTAGLGAATPALAGGLDYLHDLYTLAKPSASAAIAEGFDAIRDAAGGMGGPLKDLAFDALASAINVVVNAGRAGLDILENLGEGLSPIAEALAEVTGEAGAGATALDIVTTALNLASAGASGLSEVLGPIGQGVAWLVQAFGALPGPVQTAIIAMLMVNRVAPVMSRLAGTVSGPVVGAYRSWGDQMRVQSALAERQGQSVGRIGQHLAVLQARVPIIGQMGAAFRAAEGPAQGLARSIGVGLGGAARGLMGALGGPWGVAIAAAGVGLSMLASHQQKAAQAAAEHQSRISSLSQALKESNGAITDGVRAVAAQNVMEAKALGGKTRLVDVMEKAGVTARQLTDAYLGQGGGLDALQKQLEQTAFNNREVMVTAAGAAVTYNDQGTAAARAAKALGAVKGEMAQGVKDAKNLADAQASGAKSAADSVGPFGKFSDAMRRLSDTTADADSRARALHDALNILAGGSVNLSAAEARLNRSVLDASEALKGGVEHAEGYGKVLLNMDGSLSTVTRNGQKLYDMLQGLSTNSADAALAAYQFAEANGKSVPEALEAAQKQMATARESAISTAQGFGLTAEQAANLADKAGLVPEKVSILLQTAGMDASMAELMAVQQALKATPDKKTVTISTLSNEARAELEKLGFKITDLKDRTVQVSAPTDLARSDLDALIAKISATPGSKHVQTTAGTSATIASLEAVKSAIGSVPGSKHVTVAAPTEGARQQLTDLGFKITEIPGSKNVSVSVPTGTATGNISAIQGAINSLTGRTVTITTVHNDIWTTGARGPGPWADGYRFEADGGVVSYYADGGVRSEQHVAQIAPAGSWRVWGEPETQGEAYVPLASSKRARSKAITEEVVRRFGGEVSWFASGGLSDWSYQPSPSPSWGSGSGLRSKSMRKDKKGEETFDLTLFERNLRESAAKAERWRADLSAIASRAGQDVADALEEMGEDGIELTAKMATGSAKYINEMAEQLKKLSGAARVSLADYARQLGNAVRNADVFQAHLAQLAAAGYGSLAARLAEQGDEAAEKLAEQAVKDPSKAAEADRASRAADKALSGDQLTDLVKIIAALSTGRGIHYVADSTGIEEDRLIEVANLASAQLRGVGSRAEQFLADLARANRGLSYANGGIWEPGIFRGSGRGLIKFAEGETVAESFIPHAASKRSRATDVLAETAGRFGYGLTPQRLVDAGAGQPQVVVVQQAPAIGTQTIHVSKAAATANDIAASVAYQLRRAKRGGLR